MAEAMLFWFTVCILWATFPWPKWCWLIFCLRAASSYGQIYSDCEQFCGQSDADWFSVCMLQAVMAKVILTDSLFVFCQQWRPKRYWFCLHAVSSYGLSNADWLIMCCEQLWLKRCWLIHNLCAPSSYEETRGGLMQMSFCATCSSPLTQFCSNCFNLTPRLHHQVRTMCKSVQSSTLQYSTLKYS